MGYVVKRKKNTAVEITWKDTHLAEVPFWEDSTERTFFFLLLVRTWETWGKHANLSIDSLGKEEKVIGQSKKRVEIWWSQIKSIYVTKSWCAKGKAEEHFIWWWHRVVNNFSCAIKEHANEGAGKEQHVKWWLQINGSVPVNSKEQGKKNLLCN